MSPIINIAGPLGSGVATEGAKGPTYAALALERQDAERRQMLAELAVQEGERRRHSEEAASEAYMALATLPKSTVPGWEPGFDPQQRSARAQPASSGGPTDTLDAGLEQIVRRAHAAGASSTALRALLQDGGQILQEAASLEDFQTLDASWQSKAQHDPVAAATYERIAAEMSSFGGDPVAARQRYNQLYEAELQSQVKLAREVATSQMLDAEIQQILDPAGPFAPYFDKHDLTGELRAQMLKPLLEAKAKNGAPGVLKTEEYLRREAELKARAGGDGLPGGGEQEPPPPVEPPPPLEAPEPTGPMGKALREREKEANKEQLREAREAFEKKKVSWSKDRTPKQRMNLLLSWANAIEAQGGTAEAFRSVVQNAAEAGHGTWDKESGQVRPDPDLISDLRVALSLPRAERRAKLRELVESMESEAEARRKRSLTAGARPFG